jgi:hypothetical protein
MKNTFKHSLIYFLRNKAIIGLFLFALVACNKSSEAEGILGNDNVKAALVGLWKLTEVSEVLKKPLVDCFEGYSGGRFGATNRGGTNYVICNSLCAGSNFNLTLRFSSDNKYEQNWDAGNRCSFIGANGVDSFSFDAALGTWLIQADGKELMLTTSSKLIGRLTISRLTKTSLTLTIDSKGSIQRESYERVE